MPPSAAPLKTVKVRVPASTSNLGPAFDCLGLALGLYNELTLEIHEGTGEPVIEIEGEGAATLPRTRDNLIVRAACTVLSERPGRMVFKAVNRIPLARGLGSSAAAAVAGLFAANAVLGAEGLSQQHLLEYAATLEGHPDNVAPAILGGLALCVRRHKTFSTFPLKAHKDLCAVACIPDFELLTSKSRSVIPETYLRQDALDNVSRAALLSGALEHGHWERLAVAMEDKLHQPYRASLVPGFHSILKAAAAAGPCGAALSGAGPTMLALCRKDASAEKIGAAMVAAFAKNGVKSRAVTLGVDREGVRTSA